MGLPGEASFDPFASQAVEDQKLVSQVTGDPMGSDPMAGLGLPEHLSASFPMPSDYVEDQSELLGAVSFDPKKHMRDLNGKWRDMPDLPDVPNVDTPEASSPEDYRGYHTAPSPVVGASMDNPYNIYPEDIYGPKGVHIYGSNGDQISKEAVDVIQKARANPEAEISVYRAVPTEVKDAGINEGDWVTTTEDYARIHGDGPLKGDYRIVESKVKASELYTDGNSVHEWGFWPSANAGSEDIPLSQDNNLVTAMDRVTSKVMPNPKLKLATLYQDRLGLSIEGKDGLIWKPICKTGVLALSPGPNQVDADKPLELTPDLFNSVKSAYDAKAIEHVTIPESHGNGVLENTGYVGGLEVLTRDQMLADTRIAQESRKYILGDDEQTLYLMAGMRFTEPDVRDKVLRGTVANTSVGIKFNYRRKRDGQTFPAVLEHVALTNQPWVDGLVPFGRMLSEDKGLMRRFKRQPKRELYIGQNKTDEVEMPSESIDLAHHEGMYKDKPWLKGKKGKCSKCGHKISLHDADGKCEECAKEKMNMDQYTPPIENSGLSRKANNVTIPVKESTVRTRKNKMDQTVEELLASQQAELEQQHSETESVRQELALAQGTIAAQGEQLHKDRVTKRIGELQSEGVSPAVLERAEAVMLADSGSSSESLSLSIDAGDSTKDFDSATDVVEYILAAVPRGNNDASGIAAVMNGLDAIASKKEEDDSVDTKVNRIRDFLSNGE